MMISMIDGTQGYRSTHPYLASHVFIIAIVVALLLVSSCSSQKSSRQYSEEELAVEVLVEEYVRSAVPFASYRTLDERTYPSRDDPGGFGHERERNFFEATLRLVMHAANDTLPPDVARGSGVLHDARDEAMNLCAAEAGWPDVQLYDVSQQLGEQYEREFGLTVEIFLDLRHECAKYAATYPTLDPGVRDELLAKRRDHYMAAVRDWMTANPELVVPVEYHEGANRPYESLILETCMRQNENRQQCARDERLTPPNEWP